MNANLVSKYAVATHELLLPPCKSEEMRGNAVATLGCNNPECETNILIQPRMCLHGLIKERTCKSNGKAKENHNNLSRRQEISLVYEVWLGSGFLIFFLCMVTAISDLDGRSSRGMLIVLWK